MAHFQPGNSHGVATRFKPGVSGNPKGSQRAGESILEHWNALLAEHEDGTGKHTVADIRKIAEAEDDDPKISPARRIAAGQIIDAIKRGRRGLESLQLFFDRTLGKAPLSLNLTAGPEMKRIILMDQQAVVVQEALPEADSG